MKSPQTSRMMVLGLVALTASVHGTTYTTGFESTLYNTAIDVAGQHGWQINEPMALSSFFVNLNRNSAAALGGYYDAPGSAHVDLTHEFGGALGGTTFSADLALIPSTPLAPGFDSFGFSFRDASDATLLRLAFEPNRGTTNTLEIVYYDAANVRTSTGYDLYYGSIYHLVVSFATNGTDASFTMVLGNSLGNVQLATNVPLPGAGAAALASFGLDFDVDGGLAGTSGDNFMIFDNLNVVGPSAPVVPVPTMTRNLSNEPVFTFAAIPGTTYRLLRSTTLEFGDWSTEATVTATSSGSAELVDAAPPVDRAFYRVEVAPPGS